MNGTMSTLHALYTHTSKQFFINNYLDPTIEQLAMQELQISIKDIQETLYKSIHGVEISLICINSSATIADQLKQQEQNLKNKIKNGTLTTAFLSSILTKNNNINAILENKISKLYQFLLDYNFKINANISILSTLYLASIILQILDTDIKENALDQLRNIIRQSSLNIQHENVYKTLFQDIELDRLNNFHYMYLQCLCLAEELQINNDHRFINAINNNNLWISVLETLKQYINNCYDLCDKINSLISNSTMISIIVYCIIPAIDIPQVKWITVFNKIEENIQLIYNNQRMAIDYNSLASELLKLNLNKAFTEKEEIVIDEIIKTIHKNAYYEPELVKKIIFKNLLELDQDNNTHKINIFQVISTVNKNLNTSCVLAGTMRIVTKELKKQNQYLNKINIESILQTIDRKCNTHYKNALFIDMPVIIYIVSILDKPVHKTNSNTLISYFNNTLKFIQSIFLSKTNN